MYDEGGPSNSLKGGFTDVKKKERNFVKRTWREGGPASEKKGGLQPQRPKFLDES